MVIDVGSTKKRAEIMQDSPMPDVNVEEKPVEIAAPTPETPREKENTKQFPLRLPHSVIQDIEQVVEERRASGEIIETSIYCRYVLQHHREILDAPRLRQENAELTQRLLELQLRDVNTVETPQNERDSYVKSAMIGAIGLAAKDFEEDVSSGSRSAAFYEAVFLHYYNQLIVQIQPKNNA